MTMVRFAVVCDVCGTRGYEYGGGYSCRECSVQMSDRCACPHAANDETGRALCPSCAKEAEAYSHKETDWEADKHGR